MSDIIITVQDFPNQISVIEGGIQGPPGTGGSGGSAAFVTGVSGVLQNQITNSGAYLLSQIQISNAGVNSINSLSGIIFITGLGGIIATNNGNNIQISGGNVANINLSGINNIGISQSGQVYFVSGINLINTSQTGQFYSTSNLQGYIKSGDVSNISGILQSEINLIQNQSMVTGISINGSSQHLTGYVTFAAGNNDVSLGQNSTSIIISVPGLQQTGSLLYNLLTGTSGQLSNNIGSTGSFLFGLINASSAGVSSLNSHSGALSLTGAGNVSVIVNGQNFTISGLQSSSIQTNVLYTSGNQTVSGFKDFNTGIAVSYISGDSNFIGLIDSNGTVSHNWNSRVLLDSVGTSSIDYGSRILKDSIQNYSILWDNRVLRNSAQEDVINWNNRFLSGNWTKDGNYILTSIDSGNLYSGEQRIRTIAPSGSGNCFISFNPIFQSVPLVWSSIQSSGNIAYNVNVSGLVTISGYMASFSDIIRETGVFINTLAKLM